MNRSKYSRYYTYIQPIITNRMVKSSAPHIFSLVTIIVMLVFVIRPTVETIFKLQKTIADNQKVLAALNQKAEDLTLGKENLDAMNPQLKEKIAEAVPTQPTVPSLIRSLQIASNINASPSASPSASLGTLQVQPITIINNTSKPTGLSTGEVYFSYNIQDSYPNLMAMLNNLNKVSQLIKTDTIDINKQQDGIPILTINGGAFYLK